MNPPAAYFNPSCKLKAFVLGCDPTAFTKQDHQKFKKGEISAVERHPIPFTNAFDLDNGLKYFQTINANLEDLGMKYKEDIYVQNLVLEYQSEESSKNKQWKTIASEKIADRKKEFDTVDPSGKIPVLLTSALLYNVLLKDEEKSRKPKELYSADGEVIIPAYRNKLGRPIVPFYRNFKYALSRHLVYKEKLKTLLFITS